ncbi:MAG: hypothetical protein M3083_00985 [Actinomycetota bacterium]|nr:hypothetical protein [Actinomycetota bacterium]MDQ6947653.1 hypothetical protein [Actinomycetota bacterium]
MRRLVLLGSPVAIVALVMPAAGAQASVRPSWHAAAQGGLDCNGFSPVQGSYRHLWCTEIAANDMNGFEDNGHYVGHDEPDIGFFSYSPGSGNSMSYTTILPVDPPGAPSASFRGPTHDFQLTPARWFGMVLCDNESYPEGTKVCRPNSDANIQIPPRPNHAGAAYMELQLYPPGFGPDISCDKGPQWCAALTIDSLQAQFGALHGPGSPPNALANNNCVEPINFAFLTHSGTPGGPPGPDVQTGATFMPTSDTLKMNPGDTLTVTMHDTPAGFFTQITDVTTGETGTMTASVDNGFRHILWDPVNFTCNGAPYAFHPMYNLARPPLPNGQPVAWTTWSAHTDNIAYDVETGHFEKPDAKADLDPTEDPPCVKHVITGCLGSDADFDGYPYHPDWPNGSPQFPTPNYFTSPRSPTVTGRTAPYPFVRFETDLPRIEEANNGGGLACDHHTGAGCTNPPPGAFYPWYHLLVPPSGGSCSWGLSNDMPNQISNFGGEQAAWGPLTLTDYGFDKRYHNYARTIANPCP